MAQGVRAALSFLPRPGVRTAAPPSAMVVRAGGPLSTNSLILAFFLPLSLFIGTLVTAVRVADDLDERFLREMEINQAIMEEDQASEEDEQPAVEKKEAIVAGAAAIRTRNRPIRKVRPRNVSAQFWSRPWQIGIKTPFV